MPPYPPNRRRIVTISPFGKTTWPPRLRSTGRKPTINADIQWRKHKPLGLSRPGWIYQFASLDLFLAIDAVRRPRQRFQPLRSDLHAAVGALSEAAFLQAFQRAPHQRELTMIMRAS